MKNIMADGIQSGVKRWMSGTTKKTLDYATGQGKVGRPKQYSKIPTAVIPSEWRPYIDMMERGIRPDVSVFSGVGLVTPEGSEKVITMPKPASYSVNMGFKRAEKVEEQTLQLLEVEKDARFNQPTSSEVVNRYSKINRLEKLSALRDF